ncbi:hypothetical protein [Streptomyces antibioticus]|uniref:hypothetical protein n=1 Tax=Streptomyces antibioticus TaxID=1890 RepID=UPI0033F70C33
MKLTQSLVAVGTLTAATVLGGAGGAQAQDDGLLSLLDAPAISLICIPAGQVGQGNVVKGTQNISCSQSASQSNPPSQGGITGYEIVTMDEDCGPSSLCNADAFCPEGKRVTGGGVGFSITSTDITVHRTEPLPDGTGWRGAIFNPFPEDSGVVTTYAICADVDS